jgi:hypothetical protein
MKTKLLSIIAIIAIIATAIIGCGGNDEPTNTTTETFTVTFHANGGTPEPQKQTIEKGKTASEPKGITKANNTLEGWYKENAFTTKWNFATDTVTANVDLWAKWILADTAFREFNDVVMFNDNGTDNKADIKDARTGTREKTLEELGIIKQLQDAIVAAFGAGNTPTKDRFRNVFDPETNKNSKVTITIENGVAYASYEIDDSSNIRFGLEYLSIVSDDDLKTAITAAVRSMNDKIAMLENKSAILHIVFAEHGEVTSMNEEIPHAELAEAQRKNKNLFFPSANSAPLREEFLIMFA